MDRELTLRILERISYIIEACAEEAMGEARDELERLTAWVRSAEPMKRSERRLLLRGLEEAREWATKRAAVGTRPMACVLSGMSRRLWEQVLDDRPSPPRRTKVKRGKDSGRAARG